MSFVRSVLYRRFHYTTCICTRPESACHEHAREDQPVPPLQLKRPARKKVQGVASGSSTFHILSLSLSTSQKVKPLNSLIHTCTEASTRFGLIGRGSLLSAVDELDGTEGGADDKEQQQRVQQDVLGEYQDTRLWRGGGEDGDRVTNKIIISHSETMNVCKET